MLTAKQRQDIAEMFSRNMHINDVHRATGVSHGTLAKIRDGHKFKRQAITPKQYAAIVSEIADLAERHSVAVSTIASLAAAMRKAA